MRYHSSCNILLIWNSYLATAFLCSCHQNSLFFISLHLIIYDTLRDLVAFVQFKKREKHLWSCVTIGKVVGLATATLLKVTLLYWCFSRFLNCYHVGQSVSYCHHQDILHIISNFIDTYTAAILILARFVW